MSESALTPAPSVTTSGLVSSTAIDAAVALGKDGVEVLERLHAMAKEERAENARRAYVRAMADFRADMKSVVKDATGQHGVSNDGRRVKGKYALLSTIAAQLDPVASRHGFSYRFDRQVTDGKEYVVCFVTHADGHEESSRFPAAVDKGPGRNDIQAISSGESYAKRYALIAAFGITTADPDDDGNASGANHDTITEGQAANLQALAEEVGADRVKFLAWAGVDRLADLPASKLDAAIRMLEAKRARR